MADGGVPIRRGQSDRVLSITGWRAVRRRLPGRLRRSLPVTPPDNRWEALYKLRTALRRYREENEPVWRPRIADIAKAYGVDRSTLEDWLYGTRYRRQHGCLVIPGRLALRMARKVFHRSPPATMREAIGKLEADLQLRVRKPVVRTSYAGESDFFKELEEPRYPKLGSGPVSIDQLATLLADRTHERDFEQYAVTGAVVRAALKSLGALTDRIDPEWFKTGMGQAFWLSTYAAAEKKLKEKKAKS